MKWLVILSLCWVSMQSKADTLTLYTEHFPPYSYEQNKQVTGLNTELVRRSCELAKITCEFQLLPWLRAYEAAQKDHASGLFSTSRNPLREHLFQWVGPLAHSNAQMYWLKSRAEQAPRSLDEAKQFIVAIARGDVYELYLQSQGFEVDVNLLRFNSKSDAVLPFLHGKVDLLIASELILPVWLGQYQHSTDAVEPVIDLSQVGNNYLALHLEVPVETAARLQAALDTLRSNGEFQQLSEHFLKPPR